MIHYLKYTHLSKAISTSKRNIYLDLTRQFYSFDFILVAPSFANLIQSYLVTCQCESQKFCRECGMTFSLDDFAVL